MTSSQTVLGLAALAGVPGAASADPCRPEATLAGATALVDAVRGELAKLGDDVTAATVAPKCRRVAATLAPDRDGGIAVGLQHGRQHDERRLGDAALAAIWIDSWLHDEELVPPALAPPASTALAAPPGAAFEDHPPRRAPARRPHSAWDAIAIGAAFEQQWTTDRTRWTGATAAACVRVGLVCVGARFRFAEQAIPYAETAAARDDLSLLATASYEHTLGRIVVAPELGIGAGRGATSRIDGCRTPPGQPPMTSCTPPSSAPDASFVGDHFHVTSYTPRAEAALRVSIPLFGRVWVDGLAAATLSPFGHASAYSSSHMPPPGSDDPLALPGDSLASFQVGIGLRMEAP